MKDLHGKVAAVTGASSGIGRALAVELATRGSHLALADVDSVGLAETVALCEGRGAKVSSALVDVSSKDAVYHWADSVPAEFGQVNLIVNNAGVALGSTVEAMSYDDLDWLIGINLWGVIYGTKAFLPHLIASGDGHVVNISSVFGLISVPTQSAYNAAKFAVRGFTDTLRMELKLAGHPVSSTTVHPGGIKTNIVKHARADLSAGPMALDQGKAHRDFQRTSLTTPAKAARVILDAVEKDKRRVTVGPDAKVIDLLSRLPAPLYQGLLSANARRQGVGGSVVRSSS